MLSFAPPLSNNLAFTLSFLLGPIISTGNRQSTAFVRFFLQDRIFDWTAGLCRETLLRRTANTDRTILRCSMKGAAAEPVSTAALP
jgi:hypothetical protein